MATVRVNPMSGDNTATLFSSSGKPVQTVEKGKILKVVGETKGFYKVSATPQTPNVPRGGSADFGVICASPYTLMYNNENRHRSLGRMNNGTPIKISNSAENGMYEVTGLTSNGEKTGWVEGRFIFRGSLEPEE